MMATRIVHMCPCVRGALRNWNPSAWRDCVSDPETGRTLTPDEVREWLFDELAAGHEVVPFGTPCEGFDYTTGCPGHPVEEPNTVINLTAGDCRLQATVVDSVR